jgi:hypothetical protein
VRALTALGTLWLLAGPALAATINVNTFAQGNVAGCSLAEAISSVNGGANFGGCVATGPGYGTNDTIVLAAGTYNLTAIDSGVTGLPPIVNTVTINGNGATIARAGGPDFRLFDVLAGNLTLNDVTLTGGALPGGTGGAIDFSSTGTLTLNNVAFSFNGAQSGGAINFNTGVLVMTGGSFTGNAALDIAGSAFGGAVNAASGGNMSFTGVTFGENFAFAGGAGGSAFGGAINAANAGDLRIIDSTFRNNVAFASGSSFGGAVDAANAGNLVITGSTFTFSLAVATNNGTFGGAVDAVPTGNVIVTNSRFASNRAISVGNNAFGGGLDVENGGDLTVTGSTFVSNHAIAGGLSFGGGLIADYQGTTGLINNNCFSGNTAQEGGGVARSGAPAVDATNNWWGHPSGPSGAGPGTGDSVSLNVIFSPFQTHACEITPVPALSTWAQLAMIALLILGGLFAVSRRLRTA